MIVQIGIFTNDFKYSKLKLIQLYCQTMSLLTAGKQISVGSNNGFGRGLFAVDPQVAQRQANKKLAYKQQLRIQMQQQMRKKKEEKRRDEEEDLRLEKKFYQQLKKQTQKKPDKPQQKNDKNQPLPPQKQMVRSELFKEEFQPPKRQQIDYKFNMRANTEEDYQKVNPYLQKTPHLYQMQEEQFFDENNANRLKVMRQALEQKMNEVYRKINQSKDLEVDKELQIIRKKINSSNTGYEEQNPKHSQFQNQYSHFYKIPKKNIYQQNNNKPKNLNYESRTEVKRNQYIPQRNDYQRKQQNTVVKQKGLGQRNEFSRQSGSTNNELWGKKRGKNNFLGNRQAADFQIESISNNIDNILNEYDN